MIPVLTKKTYRIDLNTSKIPGSKRTGDLVYKGKYANR